MPPESQVSVQIFSQTYRLGSAEKDAAYIRRAAAYLDKKMRGASVGQRSVLDVAVIAAMEIAEEVLAARRQKSQLLTDTDQRIAHFTRRLQEEDWDDKDI
jgi:cell division protein ZapA (FtsZ GTPase activity inhibitor)